MLTLRPYQSAALDALRQKVRDGKRRLVLISPTGSGKTVMAAELIRSAAAKGNASLVVAHRRELVEQTHARFSREGISAGIIMSGHERYIMRSTQVGSVQTLARRELPPAKIVIVDECHHAKSTSYEKLLSHYPDALLLGLTASPWRLDGRGLGDLFEDVVVAATPRQLIADGALCDYEGFAYLAPDVSKVKVRAGDFDEEQLGELYQGSQIVGDIIGRYVAHAMGQRAILFASSIENSKRFVEAFNAAGVRTEHLDYRTPLEERAAIMARVRSGETTLLSNVGLVTEGVDIPELRVCILARPTQSLALYLQMVGRVMRPKAGLKARIHDHAENVARHGLPDDDRDYSLEASRRPKPKALRTCPACMAIFDGPWPCPVCSHEPTVEERARLGPESVDGEEVDIRSVKPAAIKRFKQELLQEAIARGFKGGWAVHRFLEKFPDQPKPWGLYRAIEAARK